MAIRKSPPRESESATVGLGTVPRPPWAAHIFKPPALLEVTDYLGWTRRAGLCFPNQGWFVWITISATKMTVPMVLSVNIVCLMLILITLGTFVVATHKASGQDLLTYIGAARNITHGKSIYADALTLQRCSPARSSRQTNGSLLLSSNACGDANPVFAIARRRAGKVIFRCGPGMPGCGIIILTSRLFDGKIWINATVIGSMLFVFYPIHEEFVIGQTQVLLLAMMMVSLALLRRIGKFCLELFLGLQ